MFPGGLEWWSSKEVLQCWKTHPGPIENPLSALRREPWKWTGILCFEVLFLWRMTESRTVLTVWSLKPLWNNNVLSSSFLPEHWHLSDQLGRLDCTVWKNSSRAFWLTASPPTQCLVETYGSKDKANSEHLDLREKWIWKWMGPGGEFKSNPLNLQRNNPFLCPC